MKKTEVAIGILTDAHGNLCVGQRMSEPFKGKWEMPGGKVEEGETILEALRREFREEGKVELTDIFRWTRIEHPDRILHLFRVHTRDEFIPTVYDQIRFVPGNELSNLDWIEHNLEFVNDLSLMLLRGSKGGHLRFNPRTMEELRDTLNYLTQNLKQRTTFRRISCILHNEALLFPLNKHLKERVDQLHHEGIEFYAPLNIDIGLPDYFIRLKKEVSHE